MWKINLLDIRYESIELIKMYNANSDKDSNSNWWGQNIKVNI